ncbi:MAG: rhomboid family intramembrane serine protease [Candidatus Hydrogenedentota bacterium]|nr:MAG: rhomboid family intramembrane serine protease [Candidatus Hydrogenedentota bacterium]
MERTAICCPNCGAVESVNSVLCHRCGAPLQAVQVVVRESFWERVTITELLRRLCIAVFLVTYGLALFSGGRLWEVISPGQAFQGAIYLLGSLSGPAVLLGGQWYRLFTAMFLHYGIIHLFFNMVALKVVGPETEQNLGKLRFLVLYLLAGLFGNLCSLLYFGMRLFQVGASGAICGLLGALYMIGRARGGVYGEILRRITTRWIVFTILFGAFVPGIDNAAHIGGMVAGAVLVKVLGVRATRIDRVI